MSEPIQCIVSYPAKTAAGAAARFDREYYLNVHMPNTEKAWGPHGMKSWSAAEFPAEHPLDGSDMPFVVQTTVTFESEEKLRAAFLAPGTKETTTNSDKFTDVKPVIWVGKVAGSKTL
ncbi:hypothetical protein P175DRAFT_0523038 [Aspergillus ochraceoroseus IBT 24754]|uniref:EthD domain-containing protein n=1 Tax=Aspergillus ochraceoroseus IBT 24754 TaxID=1392256 RepID=A0A2T5LZW5_9EURO|nr:uncharacterized protein P175DRAFT_0523038 [Aspergillus ochraceoroseus IBT 24754]PTU21825.1 hypothetical protein P175DRAFT_0523038 [Aspergillus ochraceoroseus IBT 24754]